MNTLTIAVLLVCATVAYAAGEPGGYGTPEGDSVPGGYGAPLASDEVLKGAESQGYGYAHPGGGHGHGRGHGGYGK